MNRKKFLNMILAQIDISVAISPINEIVKLVEEFRRKKHLFLSQCTPIVEDGFLFINGETVGRIAAKLPKAAFSEEAYYYEGKCICDTEY